MSTFYKRTVLKERFYFHISIYFQFSAILNTILVNLIQVMKVNKYCLFVLDWYLCRVVAWARWLLETCNPAVSKVRTWRHVQATSSWLQERLGCSLPCNAASRKEIITCKCALCQVNWLLSKITYLHM